MNTIQKFAELTEARRAEVTPPEPKTEAERSIIDRWESLKEVSASNYKLPNR